MSTAPDDLQSQRDILRRFRQAIEKRIGVEQQVKARYEIEQQAADQALEQARQAADGQLKTALASAEAQRSRAYQAADEEVRRVQSAADGYLAQVRGAADGAWRTMEGSRLPRPAIPTTTAAPEGDPETLLHKTAGEATAAGQELSRLTQALQETRQAAAARRKRMVLVVASAVVFVVGALVLLGFLNRQESQRRLAAEATAMAQAATAEAAATVVAQGLASAVVLGLDRAAVRVNPVDGALYLSVPSGEFTMGAAAGDSNELPVHTVFLDEFWIMRTEVTNAQYARCVAAGACTVPANDRWRDSRYGEHPVTDVDWQQAGAYAAWAGGRLPTEAEWEKACRGVDSRTYPWGDEAPNSELANFAQNAGDTTPVGNYPSGMSPYGLVDMAGNVWEWTADWYDAGYYAQSPARNPTGPESGSARPLRGGSWRHDEYLVRCANRYDFVNPDYGYDDLGFRLVSPGF